MSPIEAPQDVSPQVRNIRKKLAQIAALEAKKEADPDIEFSDEQLAKLDRKEELEDELEQALAPVEVVVIEEKPVATAKKTKQKTKVKTVDCPTPQSKPAVPEKSRPGKKILEVKHADDALVSPRARLVSERWEDDPVSVEDVAPVPIAKAVKEVDYEIIENIQCFTPETKASERLRKLVKATSELSQQAFVTDVVHGISRKGKWKLSLLAKIVPAEDDPWAGLLGFIAYKGNSQVKVISISKLAVVPEQRGKGYGHVIMAWCIGMARKMPDIGFISLTSLPKAIKFYKQIGFRQVDVDLEKFGPPADDDDEYVDGQVYMEYRCKGKGGQKKKGR